MPVSVHFRSAHAAVPAAAIALLLGVTIPASAAPQVLGLVANTGDTPLSCDASGCRAELSSFCLQQSRSNPAPNTVYRPVDKAEIYLVGTNFEGVAVKLPAAPHLRFTTARGFTAVEATISAATLHMLGLITAAIQIGRDVSLLPVAAKDDPAPQSDAEIAAAIGAVRRAAVRFFDARGEAPDAIRAANAMINALPTAGRKPSDSDGHLLAAARLAAAADPAGVSLARSLHAACVGKVDVTHHIYSMRDCLEGSHDRLVIRTNIQFWESLGGS